VRFDSEEDLTAALTAAARTGEIIDYRDSLVGYAEWWLEGLRAGFDVDAAFRQAARDASPERQPGGMSMRELFEQLPAWARHSHSGQIPRQLPLEACHLRRDVGALVATLAAARVARLPVLDGEVFPLGATIEDAALRTALTRLGGEVFLIGASTDSLEPAASRFCTAVRAVGGREVSRAIGRARTGRPRAVALVQPARAFDDIGSAWSLPDGRIIARDQRGERLVGADEDLTEWLRTLGQIVEAPAELEFGRKADRLTILRARAWAACPPG
jgi:hypothetical protein